jgi:hypothetical protein
MPKPHVFMLTGGAPPLEPDAALRRVGRRRKKRLQRLIDLPKRRIVL